MLHAPLSIWRAIVNGPVDETHPDAAPIMAAVSRAELPVRNLIEFLCLDPSNFQMNMAPPGQQILRLQAARFWLDEAIKTIEAQERPSGPTSNP